jgi:hypothetical protein
MSEQKKSAVDGLRHVGVMGDVHGHFQLGLSVMAQFQTMRGQPLEAVFLCGDLGSFTDDAELDSATRRHGRSNPLELEFLTCWVPRPPAPWLEYIFRPIDEGGLGLSCPVIAVHGNHEGFAQLAALAPPDAPARDAGVEDLPTLDALGRIRYLPSGWTVTLPSGLRAAGIGGIDPDQRLAKYPALAYLDGRAIDRIRREAADVDLLITHQGPASLQKDGGSPRLDPLAAAGTARVWCHGHSIRDEAIQRVGPGARSLVVPLHDVAFPLDGPDAGKISQAGWAWVSFGGDDVQVVRETPSWIRSYDRRYWHELDDGRLVCPPLAHLALSLGDEDSPGT